LNVTVKSMPCSYLDLENGISVFARLLEEEYGRPINDWMGGTWSEAQKLQIARALEILMMAPIAKAAPLSPGSREADLGAGRAWVLADEQISGSEWEETWQWRLLAAIDNATKGATGGMMTPSDPRMFVLRVRYESGFFAALAGYFAQILCGRGAFPLGEASATRPGGEAGVLPENALEQAAILQALPGLEMAEPAFIAGILFLVDQLGPKGFCELCDEYW
jgi:hypothetical protein